MPTLTVTAKGQVTLKKEVLRHLGIEPGAQIEVGLLPEGQVVISAARQPGSIDGFIGVLAGKTRERASIEDLTEAAAQGWAGRRR